MALISSTEATDRVPALLGYAALSALIDSVSTYAETIAGRTFALETVTETLNGDGLGRVWLKKVPVASLTSVTVGGDAQTVTDFTVNPDTGELVWQTDGDYRFATTFPRGRRNVVVVYSAGYATVPGPVKEACVMVLQDMVERYKQTRIYQSGSFGGESWTLRPEEFPPLAVSMLMGYRIDAF